MLDETSMAALLEVFLAETAEGLETAEEALLALERNSGDEEALALVFRMVHTIKGNAGVFAFDAMTAVAHGMEDLLDRIRAGRMAVTQDAVSTLLEGVDELRGLLAEQARGRESSPRERRAMRTLRIDVARLDRLVDLTGEIGVARGRIGQMLEDPGVPRQVVLEAERDADQLYLEMQEVVMKLRMVPVGPSFRQLQRVVRDAAQSAGKEAELTIEGGDVEVDMTIIEHLRDPLIHMVRNSVGHGIESADQRRAAGKPTAGRLALQCVHDSGSIVIELSDDGAGIDRKRVAQRALRHGLIAEGSTLSDGEMLDLVFHPGFSTAEQVTDLSGRGVGLDVVRRNVDAIHGSVSVQSREGEGTVFRLRLPLTLAIVEGLRVGVAGESFILPMGCVVEALRFPSQADPSAVTGVLTHRGESVPFLRLRRRFPAAGDEQGASARENVVIVRYPGGHAGLVVDELHGECQSVVKPLPRPLRGIPGLSGSAILPNGGIAFIVDVSALLQVEIDRRGSGSSKRNKQEKSCFPI